MKYTQLNDLDSYNERTEVALNFLAHEVYRREASFYPRDTPPIVIEAVDQGELAGAAAIAPSRELGGYVLLAFAVAENQRGRGVGSELLTVVERQAVELGTYAFFTTVPVDENAARFYRNRQYVPHIQVSNIWFKLLRNP